MHKDQKEATGHFLWRQFAWILFDSVHFKPLGNFMHFETQHLWVLRTKLTKNTKKISFPLSTFHLIGPLLHAHYQLKFWTNIRKDEPHRKPWIGSWHKIAHCRVKSEHHASPSACCMSRTTWKTATGRTMSLPPMLLTIPPAPNLSGSLLKPPLSEVKTLIFRLPIWPQY